MCVYMYVYIHMFEIKKYIFMKRCLFGNVIIAINLGIHFFPTPTSQYAAVIFKA